MKTASLIAILAIFLSPDCLAATDSTSAVVLHELQVTSGDREITLSLVVFNVEKFRLGVVDNATAAGTAKFKSLAEAMGSVGAIAGCNGGFFQRSPFAPVGVMISSGQRSGPFDPASWMKGALVLRSGGIASLEPIESFRDTPDIIDLIQSGPWLVRDGRSESDDSRKQVARRTFLCRAQGTTWAIGNSSRCTLLELANALKSNAVTAVIDIREALNFDGGPSSGLWMKRSPADFYLTERWPVRNFICIMPEKVP